MTRLTCLQYYLFILLLSSIAICGKKKLKNLKKEIYLTKNTPQKTDSSKVESDFGKLRENSSKSTRQTEVGLHSEQNGDFKNNNHKNPKQASIEDLFNQSFEDKEQNISVIKTKNEGLEIEKSNIFDSEMIHDISKVLSNINVENEKSTVRPSELILNSVECIAINNLFEASLKSSFTINPYKIVKNYFKTKTEFEQAFEVFSEKMSSNFALTNYNIGRSDLAYQIAGQFKEEVKCTSVSRISALIYRLIQDKLIEDKRLFIATFLSEVEENFAFTFLLYNFQKFLKFKSNFPGYLKYQFLTNRAKLLEQFIDLYTQFVIWENNAITDENKKYFKKNLVEVLKTGSVYAGMFLLYKATTCVETSENTRWLLDNVILYQVNTFLDILSQQFRGVKKDKRFETIDLELDDDEIHSIETQNTADIKDRYVSDEKHSSICTECQLRNQLSRISFDRKFEESQKSRKTKILKKTEKILI